MTHKFVFKSLFIIGFTSALAGCWVPEYTGSFLGTALTCMLAFTFYGLFITSPLLDNTDR